MMQSKTSRQITLNEGVPLKKGGAPSFRLKKREERRSVDSDKIRENFFGIADIGRNEDGSITRLLFSKEYEEAQNRTRTYMEEAGLTTAIDPVGNLHGVLRSENPDAKTILIGSHLDTVIQGGAYDGLLGIIAGVEAARELGESGYKLNHHLQIIAFNGEEGNDLGGTFGSRCAMGLVPAEEEAYLKKAKAFGLTKDDLLHSKMDTKDKSCFLELHIEQGNTLWQAGEEIGIVNGIVGLVRYKVTAWGQSNHAGTTRMEHRKDAMIGLAKLMVKTDQLARDYGNHMAATFGKVEVTPHAVAVIPGKAEAVLEIRNLDRELLERFFEDLKNLAQELEPISFSFEKLVEKTPQTCDKRIMEIMETLCREKHIPHRVMPSGATHDSVAMAYNMPIGMIFVPSKDGISHNGAEYTKWSQVMTGIRLLCETVKAVDKLHI